MQVSVEKTQGLEHKLRVRLPSAEFEAAFNKRLRSVAASAKLDGFRPGKIPLKVIRQRYGAGIEHEVVNDMIQKSYLSAIQQQQLKPVSAPNIEAQSPAAGQDIEYTATIEVYPEIQLQDLSQLTLKQPEVELQDADIDTMIETLRKQNATWEDVARAAQQSDQLIVDFIGTIDGEAFDGGSAENVTLVLGSKRMIAGFEDQLFGINAGEQRDIQVTFPDDYPQADLRSKQAQFAVTCHNVQEQRLPELDADFLQAFGVTDGELETLKQQVREHMQRELDKNKKQYLKRQAKDRLLEMHSVELPNALLAQTASYLEEDLIRRFAAQNTETDQRPWSNEQLQETATRIVTLDLLIAEVAKQRQITASPAEVRAAMETEAASYQNPAQVVEYFLQNQQMVQKFQGLVLEERVIESLLENVQLEPQAMTLDELMQLNQS